MRTSTAYGELRRLGRPVIETREAAALLRTSTSNAGHRLRAAQEAGLVVHLRHGLWALDPRVDPIVVAPYLTAPFPAYVSLWSALAQHDMIEQIPRQIFVASLARTTSVSTPVATYSIHHLAPELFTGFDGSPEHGYVATPEKALFDSVYVRAPRGGRAYFPELSLPAGFEARKLDGWLKRIARPSLRTRVSRELELALAQAAKAPAPRP